MKEYTFYLTVKIVVQSDETDSRAVMDEFQQETDYMFFGTEKSTVIRTEIMEAKLNYE